jgi:hypothetical protein
LLRADGDHEQEQHQRERDRRPQQLQRVVAVDLLGQLVVLRRVGHDRPQPQGDDAEHAGGRDQEDVVGVVGSAALCGHGLRVAARDL